MQSLVFTNVWIWKSRNKISPIATLFYKLNNSKFSGRLLTRQFLLPFLLGFKFNIASLVPILFGVLALLAKKALVISKLALVLVSAFGLGSLVFGYGHQQHYGPQTFHHGYGLGPHGGYKWVTQVEVHHNLLIALLQVFSWWMSTFVSRFKIK